MKLNRHSHGITLIELMVALTISSILLAGVATVYIGNKRASNLNTGLARLQENLRLVNELVSQDVRMSGFVGCRASSITNALNTPTAAEYDITKPIRGYDGDSSTGSFPTQITDTTNPAQQIALVGSDAFMVLHAAGPELLITNDNTGTATITTKNSTSGIVKVNDIVIISDCIHAAVTQITSLTGTTSFTHDVSAVTSGPGNCWDGLAELPTSGPIPSCGAAGNSYYPYATNARAMKLSSDLYYVAKSTSGLTSSLYRLSLNKGVLTQREELIEGVESMQVLYGEDVNADNIADRYVSAGNVSDWTNVSSVRIGFLIATPNTVRNGGDNKTYTIADNSIAASSAVTSTTYNGGAVVHPNDKKLRLAYTTTIKLRNKGVM